MLSLHILRSQYTRKSIVELKHVLLLDLIGELKFDSTKSG